MKLVKNLRSLPAGTWIYGAAGEVLGIIEAYQITLRGGSHEQSEIRIGLQCGGTKPRKPEEACRAFNALLAANTPVFVKEGSYGDGTVTSEIVKSKSTISASASNVPAHGKWGK